MSPSDRLKQTKAKIEMWIANDVQLAWLIDPDRKTVTIYQSGREPETLTEPEEVAGTGPVEGFTLILKSIWTGLQRT